MADAAETPEMGEMSEEEAYDYGRVQDARGEVAEGLKEVEKFTRYIERQLARLDEGDLYDVDYAESGGPRIAADAIAAIRLNVAAIRSVTPVIDPVWAENRRQAELDRRLGAPQP